MRYEEFNRLYKEIYRERFLPIKHTDFEYRYLEEEHYALRKKGDINFVIIRANSPLQAVNNLIEEVK